MTRDKKITKIATKIVKTTFWQSELTEDQQKSMSRMMLILIFVILTSFLFAPTYYAGWFSTFVSIFALIWAVYKLR